MCELWSKGTPAGREADRGDGVTIYRHTLEGFLIRTHRTVRVSPAGWVFGVYDPGTVGDDNYGAQYTYGYASTQSDALRQATHYILCRNGVTR